MTKRDHSIDWDSKEDRRPSDALSFLTRTVGPLLCAVKAGLVD